MAENALTHIKTTEEQARQIVENAREEAARIIRRAEEESADALLRFSEDCRQQALLMRNQAESAAGAGSEEFSKETAEMCAALREELLSRKEKAIDAVVQYFMAK